MISKLSMALPITALLGLLAAPAADAQCAQCTIDFASGTTSGCDAAPYVEVGQEFEDSDGDGWFEGCVRATLDPANGCTTAFVDAAFADGFDGWSLHIADSATNDGYCGDASTQSNDAEMWILNRQMKLCANDKAVADTAYSLEFNEARATTVSFEVRDQFWRWTLPGGGSGHSAAGAANTLFALGGQSDSEGDVNYDIFVCGNRVASQFRPGRTGSGLESIVLTLE